MIFCRIIFGSVVAVGVVLSAHADMSFLNATTNYLAISGPNIGFVLPPSQSLLVPPGDSDTDTVSVAIDGGAVLDEALPLQDGTLYSFNPDGSVSESPGFLQSVAQGDSDLAWYFMNGLISGSGLAAVLLGFIAVRRALSIGDNWND